MAIINPNAPKNGQLANVHPKKGFAYGVISGNKVPDLMERIFEGRNLSAESLREEIKEKIKQALAKAECEAINSISFATLEAQIKLALDDYTFDTDLIDGNVTATVDLDNEEEIIDSILEQWEIDEPTYRLEEDGFIYELSYLGGAPIIFVLDAPIITFAHRCSPCVPNAGNLDEPSKFEYDEDRRFWSPQYGIACFAIDTEEFETKPYMTRTIDEKGNVTGEWE